MVHFLAFFTFITVLSSSTFAAVVDIKDSVMFEEFSSKKSWVVEFYAPWCHHCQKLLPVLEDVSAYAGESVAIGKIDATKNKAIAGKLEITKYPTIFYRHVDNIGKYEGSRSFLGLKGFIDGMTKDPLVLAVEENDIGRTMESSNSNVSFVFKLPTICSDTMSSCPFDLGGLVRMAEKLKIHTTLLKIFDPSLSVASLCKYDRGFSTSIKQQLLYCIDDIFANDFQKIEELIVNANFPLVSELEAHNFKVLAHLNKTMFIAVIDFQSQSMVQFSREALHAAAKSVNIQDSCIFGYLDGLRWKKFAKHHEAIVPSLLVADHDNGRHAVLSMKAIVEEDYRSFINDTVQRVLRNEIPMKDTIEPTFWRKVLHRLERYSWMKYFIFFLPITLFLASFFFPHPQKKSKQA